MEYLKFFQISEAVTSTEQNKSLKQNPSKILDLTWDILLRWIF